MEGWLVTRMPEFLSPSQLAGGSDAPGRAKSRVQLPIGGEKSVSLRRSMQILAMARDGRRATLDGIDPNAAGARP
jgi:hypothetical protein